MKPRVTSLTDLIKTADELIGGGLDKKGAPKQADPFVEKLAAALENVDESVQMDSPKAEPTISDIEKIAEAVNIIYSAAEIDSTEALRVFGEKARNEGYSEDEIGEAMNKIAAARIQKSMPLMVAMGVGFNKRPKAQELSNRLLALSRQPAVNNVKTQGY